MDNFIQEIEDDIRRDRHLALWNKYGRYVVTFALIVIICAAAAVAWRHYRTGERTKDSMAYNAALMLANQGQGAAAADAALPALRAIAPSSSDSYATLARLQEAALLTKAGKPEEAVAIYDAMAGNRDIDPMLRDLAVLLRALAMFDKEDPAVLSSRLTPLTTGSAWRYTALELTALLAQRSGDTAKARDIYATLADDPNTPRQLRGRAAEMLAGLGAANG